jgi:hypothetical protein
MTVFSWAIEHGNLLITQTAAARDVGRRPRLGLQARAVFQFMTK